MAKPNAPETSGNLRPLKKLTVRDILGSKPDIRKIVAHNEKQPGAPLWLCTIIGVATAYRPGTSKAPDGTESNFVRFMGQFRGENLETGQVFRSGACILPSAIPDLLVGALQMGEAAQFGFRIGVVFKEDSAVHYEYVVESLTGESATDPLALLANAIKNGKELPPPPALSGPIALTPVITKARAS